ncbi:DUF4157 domain-containing protein [Streptomyces sp. NPDC005931]|uniref:eCIS core domain-containing protein n=1 Tax=Streptomyces sp. NPDC005931 TaxID=3364737 RepID=UPI0036C43AA4
MTTAPPGHAARDGRPPSLLALLRGEGRRLDADVRGAMERSLGAPFGDVMVHAGPASAAAADRAGAAAFTVGRHVVIGAAGCDPRSVRGRMLLAHELAHVVQQRRGGGDLDLGAALPGPALPRHHAHGGPTEKAAASAAAGSALGLAAPVSGAAPVGMARQDKAEEKDWKSALWAKAKEKIRDKTKETLGLVEGVAIEAGQIVDTVAWMPYAAQAAVDKAIDTAGNHLGASKETLTAIKEAVPGAAALNAIKTKAAASGMLDPVTGTPMVSGKITEGFDELDKGLDEHVFKGVKEEEGFFTSRDIGQLKGAIGSQVALSFVGVEEIQLALKVVSGIGAFKAIADAVQHNASGFATDRRFWTAVAGAVLHVVGLRSASSGKKLFTFIVDVVSTTLSGAAELAQLREDYLKPEGEERDKALRKDIQALIRLVAGAVQQALSHHRGLKRATAQAHTEPPAPPARTAAGDAPAPEPATAGKPVTPVPDPATTSRSAVPVPGPVATPEAATPAPAAEPAAVPAPRTPAPEPAAGNGETSAPAVSDPAPHAGGAVPPGPKAAPARLADDSVPAPTAGEVREVPLPKGAPGKKDLDRAIAATEGPHSTEPQPSTADPTAAAPAPAPTGAAPAPAPKPVKPATTGEKAAVKRVEAATAKKDLAAQTLRDAKAGLRAAEKRLARAEAVAVTASAAHAKASGGQGSGKKASAAQKELARARKQRQRAQDALVAARTEATRTAGNLREAKAMARRAAKPAMPANSVNPAKPKPGAPIGMPSGLPPAWDHGRYPRGPRRRWRAGDSVDMPNPSGGYPGWSTIRKRVWKTLAAKELAARSVSTSAADTQLLALNPVHALSTAELRAVAKTGDMPARVRAEIEHARIPQRIGRLLEKAGVGKHRARELSKSGAASNLDPTVQDWHAVVDNLAHIFNGKRTKRNPVLPASLDDRAEFPLGSAGNEEIVEIIRALKQPGVDLDGPAGTRLREILTVEKARRRGWATWEVP